MDRTGEKKFWLEFIKMYKDRPTLWNVKCPDYKDRSLKRPAYQDLLVKLRRLYPDADIDMVKRKINSMRACLRRERTKIRASRKTIAADGGKGEEYRPVWWLYNYTGFLRGEEDENVGRGGDDQEKREQEEEKEEKATRTKSSARTRKGPGLAPGVAVKLSSRLAKKEQVEEMQTEKEEEEEERHRGTEVEKLEETSRVGEEEADVHGLLKDRTTVLECDEHEMDMNTLPPANFQRNEFLDVLNNDQKNSAFHQHHHHNQSSSMQSQNDTEADMYGRCWALQYKELCADQKIYAKKAIEDIFFEAKLGTLQRNSVKINGS